MHLRVRTLDFHYLDLLCTIHRRKGLNIHNCYRSYCNRNSCECWDLFVYVWYSHMHILLPYIEYHMVHGRNQQGKHWLYWEKSFLYPFPQTLIFYHEWEKKENPHGSNNLQWPWPTGTFRQLCSSPPMCPPETEVLLTSNQPLVYIWVYF